jgi:hypothetical protein
MRCGRVVIATFVAIFAVFYALDSYKQNWYVFDQNVLQQVAQDAIAQNLTTKNLFETIRSNLAKKYPGHVNPSTVCA